MKTSILKKSVAVLTILICAVAAFGGAGTNNFPQSAGGSLPHAPGGNLILGGVSGNPALLGVRGHPPYRAITLVPTSIAAYNNLFEIPIDDDKFFDNITSGGDELFDYLERILEETLAPLNTMTFADFENKISKELDGNPFSLYVGVQTSPFTFAVNGFGLNLRTYADAEIRLPEDALKPLFIEENELLSQRIDLDLSDLDIEAIWATEIGAKLGFSRRPFGIFERIGLNRMALGAGVSLVLGHSYTKIEASENTSIVFDTTNFSNDINVPVYEAQGKIEITEIGGRLTGLRREGDDSTGTDFFDPWVTGQGWKLDLGAVFYNDNHLVSFDVQDIGMIFWDGSNIYKSTVDLDATYSVADLAGGSFFDLILGDVDTDSLEVTDEHLITWMPMAANLGYTYFYDLKGWANIPLGYVSVGGNYRQQILLGPGRNSYSPRLSAGATLGLFGGILPVRYGVIFGGQEEEAAAVGVGLDLRYLAVDASFKSVGSLAAWDPKKGFEAAAALTFKWRHRDPRFERAVIEEAPPPPPPPTDLVIPPLPELPDFPEVEDVPLEVVELDEVEYEEVIVEIDITPEPEPEPAPEVEPTYEPIPEPETFSTQQRAINFRSGGADLTAGSYDALRDIAAFIIAHPQVRYEIQGHTDSQGSATLNMRLSVNRAVAVKNALIAAGVPEGNVIAIGYGPSVPIADNATVQGRALNRRVEFVQIESQERYDALREHEAAILQSISGQ